MGLIGLGIFHMEKGLIYENVHLLRAEILGIVVIIVWSATMSCLILFILKKANLLVESHAV